MNNQQINKNLAKKVVSFLLFPSLWIKIIFSFSVSEGYEKDFFYQLFSFSDVTILVAIICWWLLVAPSKLSRTTIYIVLILFVLNLLTWLHAETNFFKQLVLLFKIVLPLLFFMVLLEYGNKYPVKINRFIILTIFILVVCTIYGFVFFDPVYNRSIEWMPAYFSSLHTTSYLWVGIFLVLFGMSNNKNIKKILWVLIFILISLAWGVRAAQGALIVFMLLFLFNLIQDQNTRSVLFTISVAFLLALIFIVLFERSLVETLNQWSSGRLDMYIAKIEQLINSGIITLLIGGGSGSDQINTAIWWWGKKGAHNDYFTILVEQGLCFIIIIGILYYILINSFKDNYIKLIVYIYLFTSLVSNGFMVRPLAAYIIFLAACAYLAKLALLKRSNAHIKIGSVAK